jgi:hypothetical protein
VLPEPTYRYALALFGQRGLAKLTYLVRHYCFVSTTLNGFASKYRTTTPRTSLSPDERPVLAVAFAPLRQLVAGFVANDGAILTSLASRCEQFTNASVRPEARVRSGGNGEKRPQRYGEDPAIAVGGVGRSERLPIARFHCCPAALPAEAARPAGQTEQPGRKLSASPSTKASRPCGHSPFVRSHCRHP